LLCKGYKRLEENVPTAEGKKGGHWSQSNSMLEEADVAFQ
jgi:hypothetical protein